MDKFEIDLSKKYEGKWNTITPERKKKFRELPRGYAMFNEDWALSKKGDMRGNGCYDIISERLEEGDWILHLMEKMWFDANTFLPAYFEACRRAGIKQVTITTFY